MREITLEVVDTNGRARALYERHGFTLIRTLHSGPVTAAAAIGLSAVRSAVGPW